MLTPVHLQVTIIMAREILLQFFSVIRILYFFPTCLRLLSFEILLQISLKTLDRSFTISVLILPFIILAFVKGLAEYLVIFVTSGLIIFTKSILF